MGHCVAEIGNILLGIFDGELQAFKIVLQDFFHCHLQQGTFKSPLAHQAAKSRSVNADLVACPERFGDQRHRTDDDVLTQRLQHRTNEF